MAPGLAPAFCVPSGIPRYFLRKSEYGAPTERRCSRPGCRRIRSSPTIRLSSSSSLSRQSFRCAVLGAGFAGLSVTWNLLQHIPKGMRLKIDIFDEVGIGGGASGVSGGLLHPYSPKVKLLWKGAECWNECLKLLRISEAAAASGNSRWKAEECEQKFKGFIVRRRGILRPVMNLQNLNALNGNALKCIESCIIESVDKDTAQALVPKLSVPLGSAFYMPEALTINPQSYLQGLFLACENMTKATSSMEFGKKEMCLHKESIETLLELAEEYDAVVICVGAKATVLPELSERLPLRTCRGVIADLQLPDDTAEAYPGGSPSILFNAWLAFQDSHSLRVGSTWEWDSIDHSSNVSAKEASGALEELLGKASSIYPPVKKWKFREARAGVRAMPPLTPSGPLPLIGRVDDLVGGRRRKCKYWLFGGLGARGLLYHAWLGKVLAEAMVCGREEAIPPELTSWRESMLEKLING